MTINTYMVLKDLFNSIDSECFEGFYIAKINIAKLNSSEETKETFYKQINKRNMIILKSYEVLANSIVYEIQITYFKPSSSKNIGVFNSEEKHSSELSLIDDSNEIRFDSKDMKWFYDNCSDSNSLHYGENPVLPAIVILKKIDFYLDELIKGNNSVSIKFNEPIYLLDNLKMSYTKCSKFELTDDKKPTKKRKIIICGVK